MVFDKEQLTFPSVIHHNIHFAALRFMPLERSLEGIADQALRASCAEYHAFLLDMLRDMYEAPEAYGLPVYELERFLGGRKVNGVKRKQPAKTKALLSQTHNAVESYERVLLAIGAAGEPRADGVTLPSGAADAIFIKAKTGSSPIDADTRQAALARVGLVREGDGFSSMRHPSMFAGLCALSKASGDAKAIPGFNFINADFRQITSVYRSNYEDYARVLPDARRAIADALDAHVRALKARPNCSNFWKADYKYKNMQVMCLETDGGNLTVRINGSYNWDDPSHINALLEKESAAFQKYILRHLLLCTGCSTSHDGGGYQTVLGQRKRVCGAGIAFRWINPGPEDLGAMKRCTEMRCEVIDAVKT